MAEADHQERPHSEPPSRWDADLLSTLSPTGDHTSPGEVLARGRQDRSSAVHDGPREPREPEPEEISRDGDHDIPSFKDAGEAPAGAGHDAGGEAEPDPLSAALAERDEYLDALRRLQAELENYRKRIARQQKEHAERATEALVTKLLPVFDALDLAVRHAEGLRTSAAPDDLPPGQRDTKLHGGAARVSSPENATRSEPASPKAASPAGEDSARAAPEGLSQIRSMLLGSLEGEGLLRINPCAGDPFDPALHEAVIHSPIDSSDDTPDAGPVVEEVLRVGYCWKGRIVRAAMVKVKG